MRSHSTTSLAFPWPTSPNRGASACGTRSTRRRHGTLTCGSSSPTRRTPTAARSRTCTPSWIPVSTCSSSPRTSPRPFLPSSPRPITASPSSSSTARSSGSTTRCSSDRTIVSSASRRASTSPSCSARRAGRSSRSSAARDRPRSSIGAWAFAMPYRTGATSRSWTPSSPTGCATRRRTS